jgi:hypothetical protein
MYQRQLQRKKTASTELGFAHRCKPLSSIDYNSFLADACPDPTEKQGLHIF